MPAPNICCSCVSSTSSPASSQQLMRLSHSGLKRCKMGIANSMSTATPSIATSIQADVALCPERMVSLLLLPPPVSACARDCAAASRAAAACAAAARAAPPPPSLCPSTPLRCIAAKATASACSALRASACTRKKAALFSSAAAAVDGRLLAAAGAPRALVLARRDAACAACPRRARDWFWR